MEETFITTMKQLCIFTILAQTILHICANKSFEKYIRLLVSCMSIMIIIMPILEFVYSIRGNSIDEYKVGAIASQYELEESLETWNMESKECVGTVDQENELEEISTIVIEPIEITESK